MPITCLLQKASFGPYEIAVMVAAFEGALRELDLTDRTDPATEMYLNEHLARGGWEIDMNPFVWHPTDRHPRRQRVAQNSSSTCCV